MAAQQKLGLRPNRRPGSGGDYFVDPGFNSHHLILGGKAIAVPAKTTLTVRI